MAGTPAALPVVVVNAVGGMPADRGPLSRRVLRAARHSGAALIAGVECDDLGPGDLDDILPPDRWWVQHAARASADGLLLAGRRDLTAPERHAYLPGATATPVNARREILTARVRVTQWGGSLSVAVAHFPRRDSDPRVDALAARARGLMADRARRAGTDLVVGDLNLRQPEVRRLFPGRDVRSAEVVHAVVGPRLEVAGEGRLDLLPGTGADDHPGKLVRVRPAR